MLAIVDRHFIISRPNYIIVAGPACKVDGWGCVFLAARYFREPTPWKQTRVSCSIVKCLFAESWLIPTLYNAEIGRASEPCCRGWGGVHSVRRGKHGSYTANYVNFTLKRSWIIAPIRGKAQISVAHLHASVPAFKPWPTHSTAPRISAAVAPAAHLVPVLAPVLRQRAFPIHHRMARPADLPRRFGRVRAAVQ